MIGGVVGPSRFSIRRIAVLTDGDFWMTDNICEAVSKQRSLHLLWGPQQLSVLWSHIPNLPIVSNISEYLNMIWVTFAVYLVPYGTH